jgi:hypothetical protein
MRKGGDGFSQESCANETPQQIAELDNSRFAKIATEEVRLKPATPGHCATSAAATARRALN